MNTILKYQSPRVSYYLSKLKKELETENSTTGSTPDKRQILSEKWLRKLPGPEPRKWIDDNDNEFQFSGASLDEAENVSKAALSAQSLKNISDEVEGLFKLVDQISSVDENEDDGQIQIRECLKQLLPSLFSAWRSPRFQASIKARLHIRFQNSQNLKKRRNAAFTALKFLCQIYYSVDTFVQAAESMTFFKSMACIPTRLQPAIPTKTTSDPQETPLQIAKSLGLHVHRAGWLKHLGNQEMKNKFRKFRRDKCGVHAEIQLLSHIAQVSDSEHENGFVHPYIGCSKLCCLLCWLFIGLHGTYQVRGTHKTVMNRWEIPAVLLIKACNTEFQPILQNYLGVLRDVLQDILKQPFPLKLPELLAQSSAALSTTQTVLDREKAQMEKTQLNMRFV